MSKICWLPVFLAAVALKLSAADRADYLFLEGQKAFLGKVTIKANQARQSKELIQQRDPSLGPVVEETSGLVMPLDVEPGQQPVGNVRLDRLLNKNLALFRMKLGAHDWLLGSAVNGAANKFFMTFWAPERNKIAVLEMDFERLRGDGTTVVLDEQTSYRVRLIVNFLNPVRASTFNFEPAGATQGQSYQLKTGEFMDAIKANSYVFSARGAEFWMVYGNDIDAAAGNLAVTSSFGFIKENGMDTKLWSLAEAKLPPGGSLNVTLGSVVVRLVRARVDELTIYE
ncbi:MAG: hypothetical protein HY747_09750 [Elusimicrobia bacterium]|nr:hypothetical protein [Elusimicrobiota bacterium]